MSERSLPGLGSSVADGLDLYLSEFLAGLAAAGYAEETQHDKRRYIVSFIRWARDARVAVADVDEACVGEFLARSSRRRFSHGNAECAALHQFLEHLRVVGVTPRRRPSEPSPADVLVARYLEHLRGARGLCDRSIEVYAPFVGTFVATQGLPERAASLDASVIRAHVLGCMQNRSPSSANILASALRSFLRFVFLEGGTATDLSTAIPPVRRWVGTLPSYLTPEEVERVVSAMDRSTPRGRRAFAILLLLARLGLRAGEVVALELDDIRWDVGELLVRGKGRLHEHVPLLEDVGQALASYLRDGRGTSPSRRVFLRICAPRVGLSGPTAVCQVARQALRRAGLTPTGRVGAHIFRRSLATRMIQRGASLEEISQVLRHRSIDTTRLYAKVDLEALRTVALRWPTAEASQ